MTSVVVVLIAVRLLWVQPLPVGVQRNAGVGPWRVPVVPARAGTRGVAPLAGALSTPVATDDAEHAAGPLSGMSAERTR